jgi:hypothetical protein
MCIGTVFLNQQKKMISTSRALRRLDKENRRQAGKVFEECERKRTSLAYALKY